MIGHQSYWLSDRDMQGDIFKHGTTLQVLAPGFWKILLYVVSCAMYVLL